MITVPIAVHNNLFKWQLDLFWFNHRLTYGETRAKGKAFAVIINQDNPNDPVYARCEWALDMPYNLCKPYFKMLKNVEHSIFYKPLNIQIGLSQILDQFHDDQVLEIVDCDMFHFREHPVVNNLRDDQIMVCDLYEPWHLKSLSQHRNVIDIYFENGGRFYNGGFVPIIGRVKTFKKILYEWTAVHCDILSKNGNENIKWWAGMYALNAACEKKQIYMIAQDTCYIPPINELKQEHYICHYSVDKLFDKRAYPKIDIASFNDNLYYSRLGAYIAAQHDESISA